MIDIMKVYIKIRHYNFWFGEYGFTEKSKNDEFWMYTDADAGNLLGYFDVSTKECLEYYMSDEAKDEMDEQEQFLLKNFYHSDRIIEFEYLYPEKNDEYQSFDKLFAPINDFGLKPSYILVWTKTQGGWDKNKIMGCAKMLAEEFLRKNIEGVEILDVPSFEETKKAYEEDFLIKK
jgi:hypothetical protein